MSEIPPDEFNLTTLRVEATAETRVEVDQTLLGRGVQFPSGTVVMEWNRSAYPEDDRLEYPHQSVYGSIADVEQGTGGRVVVESAPDDTQAPTDETDDTQDTTDDTTDDATSDPVEEPVEEPETEPETDPVTDDGDQYILRIASNRSTPAMTYRFAVPGEVQAEASLETHDEIQTDDGETVVTGMVGPKGADTYRLDALPTSWKAVDPNQRWVAPRRYVLELDGATVTPADLVQGDLTRRVEVATPGEVEYQLEASGEIRKVTDAGDWSAEKNDTVRQLDNGNWVVDGYTGNGYGDAYDVAGDLESFAPAESDTPLGVYVDGVQVDPASFAPGSKPTPTEVQVGGGEGYARTVPPTEADAEASTLSGLQDALGDATAGDVVYVAPTATIDLGGTEVTVPEGVTLASNRGIAGAPGGHIRTDREIEQVHAKANARITGLRIQGKYYEYFDPRDDPNIYPNGSGVEIDGEGVEVDNCEIWGQAHAAVDNNSNTSHIHHNHLHHTPRAGLGYGVVTWGGHPVIEYNYFNYNRHAVAGSGGGRCGYTARYNHVGPDTIGHIFDMHKPGGDRIDIYRNTVEGYQMLQSKGGQKYTAAVMVRGVPSKHCRIEDNWFYNDKEPRDQPSSYFTNEAIVQVHVTEWQNMTWRNNHLGQDDPGRDDIGAPALWQGPE